MILPSKHIKIAESYVGFGGYLLSILKEPLTFDELWLNFQKNNISNNYPAYQSIDDMILSLNLLFAIGAIDIDKEGKLFYATA